MPYGAVHGHIDPLCPANTACAEHFIHGGQIRQEQLGQTCWVPPSPPPMPPGHIYSVSRSMLLQMEISPAVLFVKLFQLNKLPTACILVLSPPVRAGGSTSPPPGPVNTKNTLN